MLRTKSILKEKESTDGLRISIMSRHTYNDGITKDPRIKKDSYDLHFKILSPPEKLIGDYYKRGLTWNDFKRGYLDYLKNEKISLEVKKLAKKSLEENITILCIEDSPEKCHRRLLAEECKKYEPNLKIIYD